jgi:hypothetical protein
VLGKPVALIAEPVRKLRQIERVAQSARSRRNGSDGRQIEHGKWGHAGAGSKFLFTHEKWE